MRRRLALGAIVCLAAAPVAAHHGWSGYDSANVMTLEGSVAEVNYGNPHVMINLQAQDKTWAVVLAPPSRMGRRGLPEGSLEAGQNVTVEGYPHRSEGSELRAERITVAGNTVELR